MRIYYVAFKGVSKNEEVYYQFLDIVIANGEQDAFDLIEEIYSAYICYDYRITESYAIERQHITNKIMRFL